MKHVVLVVAILNFAALAQSPTEIGEAIGQSMKQNTANLRQYTYKRRTEIAVKGEVRSVRVDLVRFVGGEMEAIPLSQPPQQPAPGGIRGRIVEKKKEEMGEYMERLTSLCQRYLAPGGGDMQDLLQKASFSFSGQGGEKQVRIVVTGDVKLSDSVAMTFDLATHKPVQTQVRTDLDGDPVAISVDYSTLPDGTAYPARSVISYPKHEIRISMDSFDYMPARLP